MYFRVNLPTLIRTLAALSLLLSASAVHAQVSSYQCTNVPTAYSSSTSSTTTQVQVSENFTCNTTVNQWFFYNGACLTAGNNSSTSSPGYLPSCQAVTTSYYNVANSTTGKGADPWLAGGYYGFLGDSSAPSGTQDADPILSGVGHGALRFTNADGNNSNGSYGYHENGAVVSNFTFPTNQGIEVTFKTATYYGDSGGNGKDGADGISFYLLDACMPLAGSSIPSTLGCGSTTNSPYKSAYGSTTNFPGIGAWGGSLAYTCSNVNSPYDGITGGYLGLGIDEYGNFLNGSSNTLGETDSTSSNNGNGDNTASGGLYLPGRIGLRGAGSISWQALTNAYGSYTSSSSPFYPSSLATSCNVKGGTYSSSSGLCVNGNNSNPTDAMWAVQQTCQTGNLYNFANSSGNVTSGSVNNPNAVTTATLNSVNTANILDYPAVAYAELSGVQIANEVSPYREGSPPGCSTASSASNPCNTSGSGSSLITYGPATPITYDMKITPDGYLSLKYSVNGAAYVPIINNQSFTGTIGSPPANVRFGFAGSDGGASNVHEIMCFKATPAQSSSTSGSVTVYQDPTVHTGAQIFTAFYDPNDWAGRLQAQAIVFDTTKNLLTVQSAPTWDASCVLTPATGTPTNTPVPTWCSTLTYSTELPSSRQILSWNDSTAAPEKFEWSGGLNGGQTTALGAQTRLNYLRGDRSNELTTTNSGGLYRERTSVLGDIVDSSPAWVGPPQTYTTVTTWADNFNVASTQPENGSSAQTYSTFASTNATRENVAYVGSNDGMLHAFRAGSLDANGNVITTTYANDGYEALAYMPAAVVKTIHNSTTALDYSNTLYSHNWFVDAPPATGDIFYNNAWQTWLIGGLGPGGAAIYALKIGRAHV